MSSSLPSWIEEKIAICFSTRFGKPLKAVRCYFKMDNVQQWARVRRLNGDDMRAASLNFAAEDRRDATFIRYDLLVDQNARKRRKAPHYEIADFYGQLEHILVVQLPRAPELDPALQSDTTYILAAIHRCEVDMTNSMGFPVYSKMGRKEVVDITTVQCLVGRAQTGNNWVIIDRSGELQQSTYSRDE
ncbi:hypothetical protein F5887DRAFT_971113 [Amanita rubescens]|nr:hypothetical protein F5887DRAFT_971113 [Amanita rubescens]